MAQQLTNPTRIHEDAGLIPGLAQGSGVAMSCGIDQRCGSDSEVLWPWCRSAAVTPIQPLAYKLPYAVGAALKRKK